MTRIAALSTAAILFAAPAFAADEDFKPLFNGKDMTGFKTVLKAETDAATWTVKDGIIQCTGKPNGYFYTEKTYKNFVLKFDFRYPEKPGNSGYLIHITGEQKVWPKCIEVQGMFDQAGLIFAINGATGPDNRKNEDLKQKVLDARKSHQEWNTLEITSQDGKLTAKLNGTLVGEGDYSEKEGNIGFQSEGAPIDFQNIMIKTMD